MQFKSFEERFKRIWQSCGKEGIKSRTFADAPTCVLRTNISKESDGIREAKGNVRTNDIIAKENRSSAWETGLQWPTHEELDQPRGSLKPHRKH